MFNALLIHHRHPGRPVVRAQGDIVPGGGIVEIVHAVGHAGHGGQQILAHHAVDPGAVLAVIAPFNADGPVAVTLGDIVLPQ